MRKKTPDKNKARSILQNAKEDMDVITKIFSSSSSPSLAVRNIYESFRMLGEALLINKGEESTDHISSLNELLKLNVNTSRPAVAIDLLRKIRHKINYYGYRATKEEAEEAISIAKSCFNPLFEEINKIIKEEK